MTNTLLSPPEFPNAEKEPFLVTSPSSGIYNCIAWALELQHAFLWPGISSRYEWSPNLPRKNNLVVFLQFFQEHGFESCDDGELEMGFQKIALFAIDKKTTHAARQLPNGFWTSKIGGWVDVQHTLRAMEGGMYGDVAMFLKRKI